LTGTFVGLIAALALTIPAGASAAVTFGGSLATAPTTIFGCGGGCTFIQNKLASSQQIPAGSAAPSDGVVVRWSIRSGTTPAPTALRLLHRVGPTTFTGAGTSAIETPAENAISTFATRLPVKAGDVLGLDTTKVWGVGGGGLNTSQRPSPLVDGATETATASANIDLTLNADVEPDADGDGFGDETQDGCATDATTQGPCPDLAAPETTLTEAPKRKTRKRRVRIAFASSESGSTFECRVGEAAFEPCSSPTRVKLKRGRNLIEVRATDAAGNVDATPATAKVRRKR